MYLDVFEYFKDKSYNVNDLIWQNPWNQEHNVSVNGEMKGLPII